MSDVALVDDFDDVANAAVRQPNSFDRIANIDRMIESLNQERKRIEKNMPLDSIPVMKLRMEKLFGRLPVKGDYIRIIKKKYSEYDIPLIQVVDEKIGFHGEDKDLDPDDDDPYWGCSAHILTRAINPILTVKEKFTRSFGLRDLDAKSSTFQLLTQAEVQSIPTIVTLTSHIGTRDLPGKGYKSNPNYKTLITSICCTSPKDALKQKAQFEKELVESFPTNFPKRKLTMRDWNWSEKIPANELKLETEYVSFAPGERGRPCDRSFNEVGKVTIKFTTLKKPHMKRRVITLA